MKQSEFPKDRVKQALKAAFAGVPPPAEGNILVPQCVLSLARIDEILAGMRKIHWEQFPAAMSRADDLAAAQSLRAMTPEAFAFFLPGFLLTALESEHAAALLDHVR